MNATPWPATTALRTDSCNPSSSRDVEVAQPHPGLAQLVLDRPARTPAPSCITINFSPLRSSSETVFPAKR